MKHLLVLLNDNERIVPVWSNQKKKDEARKRQKDQQKREQTLVCTSWKDSMVDKILSSYAQVAYFFVGWLMELIFVLTTL